MKDNHTSFDVVIVGAGHAGAQVAIGLRQRGYKGSIAIIGDESELPYERPPLSKEYLLGDKTFDRIMIRPESFWRSSDVALMTSQRVVTVNATARVVICQDKSSFGYGYLIWAGGGHARSLPLPGAQLAGVHSVRTRKDVDSLAAQLPNAARVCVIGGGYIGLESAAVLRKLGKQVTVLEGQHRLLPRVTGEIISRFLAVEHRAHGVDIRLATPVEGLEQTQGTVSGVKLADGEVIDCQIVIVGIGIVPSVAPLLAAGANGTNGVDVDAFCRTSLEGVFAIGDCASHANVFADGQAIRLESVQNAVDMAATVAKQLTGTTEPYNSVPWFWSNQFDLRLQTMGLLLGYDQEVIRGDPESRSFSVVYLKEGRVRALDCINATKDYVGGRALVLARATVSPDRLADVSIPLKEIQVH